MKRIFIDTTDNKKTIISLETNDHKETLIKDGGKESSQNVLLLIDEILKKNKLTPQDLSEIGVNEGPGSFTGIKVGVSVANALAYYLSIPVNGKKIGALVSGKYK